MKHIFFFSKIFFFILAINFFLKVEFDQIKKLDSGIFYSILTLLIFHFLRILRTKVLFNYLNINFSYSLVSSIYYIGLAFGLLTPGRLGEIYRLKLFKEENLDTKKYLKYFFLEKSTDLLALFLIISFIFMFLFLSNRVFLDFIISLLFLVLAFSSKLFLNFFLFLFKVKKNKSKKILQITKFIQNMRNYPYFSITIFTCFTWIFFIFSLYSTINLLFKFTIVDSLIIFCINSIVTSLPITFMGLGLRELIITKTNLILNNEIIALISIHFIVVYLISICIGIFYFMRRCIWKKK